MSRLISGVLHFIFQPITRRHHSNSIGCFIHCHLRLNVRKRHGFRMAILRIVYTIFQRCKCGKKCLRMENFGGNVTVFIHTVPKIFRFFIGHQLPPPRIHTVVPISLARRPYEWCRFVLFNLFDKRDQFIRCIGQLPTVCLKQLVVICQSRNTAHKRHAKIPCFPVNFYGAAVGILRIEFFSVGHVFSVHLLTKQIGQVLKSVLIALYEFVAL